MRRFTALAACAIACLLVGLDARQAATQPPATPPQQGQAQGQPPQQQQPVFRSEVDVIRLDVSVLDKDRRPVHDLTIEDFTVTEDGKPQRLVAVTEILAGENDLAPSAWMRHAPRDVAANDLVDQVGDGRVIAIVMDDFNTPFDADEIIRSAREVGRYIIDGLGPSDMAAVVFPQDSGRSQDFTEDRGKLLAAIDRFRPTEIRYMVATPQGTGQGGGDMPYRYSSAIARTTCERTQPTVPALDILTSRLATIPNRRKTVVVVSPGVPLNFGNTRDCPGTLVSRMLDVFRLAQKANVNIYSIDPGGANGFENYLQDPIRANRRGTQAATFDGARARARVREDFLEITADYTGARAITNLADMSEIDDMFAESSNYYLLGYQTSNGKPDGKFRRVDVKVKKPGMTVRTRSGFYAPKEGSLERAEQKFMPATSELGLSGLARPAALPLRAVAVPVGRSGAAREVDVAVVLTVRLPAKRGSINEGLTLIRNIYDEAGSPGPPVEEKLQMTVENSTGDDLRYDVRQKLTLAPGRYQIRLNATSRAMDKSGTVFADVDVPDFTRPALSLSGISLGTPVAPGDATTGPLAAVLPIVPTSARDFSPNESPTAYLRVYQGGTAALTGVTVRVQVMDLSDASVFDKELPIAAEAFDASRGAPIMVELPFATFKRGPHLLSVSVARPGGATVRRDLMIRIR